MLEKQALVDILEHWSISREAIANCEQIFDKPVYLITTRQGEKLVLKAAAERSGATCIPRASGWRCLSYLTPAPALSLSRNPLHPLSLSERHSRRGRTAPGYLHPHWESPWAPAHSPAAYPDMLPSWHMDLVSEVFEHDVARILAYSQRAERSRLAAVIAKIEPGIRATCTNLPAQYLHGDCGGSNFLIDGDNVGIIDLDHLYWGPRIYDLAYFLTHQVKWSTEATHLTTAWLECFPHVLTGYEQVNLLSRQEKEAIWPMMLAVHLLVTDYLIQHQDNVLADLHLAALFWLYEHQEDIAQRITQN